MKKSLAIAALLVAAYGANAQESATQFSQDSVYTVEVKNADKHRVETNHFRDNWFLGFGVGGQMIFSDHGKQMDFFDRISPAFEVSFGKWFTPGLALRGVVSGYQLNSVGGWNDHSGRNPNNHFANYEGFFKSPLSVYGKDESNGYDLYKTDMKYIHAQVDALFNLSNLICGYNENRIYSAIPYAGLGFIQSFDRASRISFSNGKAMLNEGVGERTHEVTANVGLLNRFRLSSALDLNLDVRGTYGHDRMDQEIGGRWGEGILSATVGLTYNFNKRNWDRSTNSVLRVNEGLLNNLRNRVSDLQNANDDLRRQLETALNREVTKENVSVMPLLVTFPIDRWVLCNKDRVNLGFLADALKANPKLVYSIVGFADKGTGSSKRNVFLARKRSEVIYNFLVKECGVSESQLTRDSKGGVANMYYNDPRCSRAVLAKIAE